jgi:SpoVK/Ycf46/Vps4 family AAA+-type ATPase
VRDIIANERKQGHNNIADDLEKALQTTQDSNRTVKDLTRTSPNSSPSYFNGKLVPLSKGDSFPLLEVRNPETTIDGIVLTKKVSDSLEQILFEEKKKHKLSEYGLKPLSRVLFYGPPGCGKTLASEVVANELGCPLYYVRFDSVISSYLGETSSNLRRVFDFATNGLSVLFFDEFDAIGKSRDITEEVGELKRVVNSFLQMMDNFQGKSIIITATNHEKLLDSALWRRFDKVVFFGLPEKPEISRLLKLRLQGVYLRDFSVADIVDLFIGLSYSDITKICYAAIKRMILSDQNQLCERDLRTAFDLFLDDRPRML